MNERRVHRFVERLLRGKRPRAFRAEEADVEQLRAAIVLRAARPGNGVPREEFVTGLHRRLAAEMADTEPDQEARPAVDRTRRRVVQGAALAAASAAVGATVDHAVTSAGRTAPQGQGDRTLTPTTGEWHTVVASEDLPDGAVRAFDLGSVVGFVQRTGGIVQAVSGTCTHQGCRLSLDAASRRLNCPCHTTAFAVTGELLTHQLPAAPNPLPRLSAREHDGAVQVYTPPTNT